MGMPLSSLFQSSSLFLLKQAAKKFQRVHAMGGIMRAGVHATRLFMIQAEITRCRLHLDAGNPLSRIGNIINLDWERMHIDISIRTVVGALAAADTPVLNNHFERIAPANRSHRTADHA